MLQKPGLRMKPHRFCSPQAGVFVAVALAVRVAVRVGVRVVVGD